MTDVGDSADAFLEGRDIGVRWGQRFSELYEEFMTTEVRPVVPLLVERGGSLPDVGKALADMLRQVADDTEAAFNE